MPLLLYQVIEVLERVPTADGEKLTSKLFGLMFHRIEEFRGLHNRCVFFFFRAGAPFPLMRPCRHSCPRIFFVLFPFFYPTAQTAAHPCAVPAG